MSKGNSILVSANMRGRKIEGYINAALQPGVIVQIDVSEGVGGDGRFDYEAWNVDADGNQRPLFLLLEDDLQGKLMSAAYVSGDRCFLYFPQPGEEFNVLLLDISGTGDDFVLGDLLIVNDGDGKLIATTGSPESEPFMVLEAITDPTADTLVHVLYTGY